VIGAGLPASPLRAARAAASGAWALALAGVVLGVHHPAVLLAGAAATVVAGWASGGLRVVLRTAAFAVPFALVLALVNALVVREGLTVLWRFGRLPPFGQVDLTLEALVFGLLQGGRIVVVVALLALASAAIDADDVLRALRRVSFRSALTAALAVRLVPVLARDARRMADARRLRATGDAGRVAVLRAVTSSALDRAVDVAATLEVRGYASSRGGRPAPRPVSRHDRAFLASAAALVVLALLAPLPFATYPRLEAGPGWWALALLPVALLPFADRRGIER
jgi:energy-coupling factor transport system permease protein